MNELFVDPAGMTGVYNVLAVAACDAREAHAYTTRHCSIDFVDAGLLLIALSGPHTTAYGSVTKALDQLAESSQGAATQINLAQVGYATTDIESAAKLDRAYPGALDPAGLRGTLTQPRPDLAPVHTPFAQVAHPMDQLVPPNYATDISQFQLNLVTDLLSPSAWIRQVSIWLFNYDPFEGWLKEISGDWQAYQHASDAWAKIGAAAGDTGRNLVAGAADVSTVWRGNAAEAEQELQLALATAALALEGACAEYGPLYWKAADAAKQLFSSVGGMLNALIDVLILINLAAAVGTASVETVIGPIAGYAVAAYYTWQAYELYKGISSFFQTAEIVIRGVAGAVLAVQSGQEVPALPTLSPYEHPANG